MKRAAVDPTTETRTTKHFPTTRALDVKKGLDVQKVKLFTESGGFVSSSWELYSLIFIVIILILIYLHG